MEETREQTLARRAARQELRQAIIRAQQAGVSSESMHDLVTWAASTWDDRVPAADRQMRP